MLCIVSFDVNKCLFFTINIIIDNMYCEYSVKVPTSRNDVLNDVFGLAYRIILIIFFCAMKTFLLSGEFPQNIMLYVKIEWIYEE